MKKVFFLGGLDAEMIEIGRVLAEIGADFFNKKLGWGAKASAYAEEIATVAAAGNTPVMVELELDITVPEGTMIVDHHGDRAAEPAAILQVLNLLGMEPTRQQLLIAANDSGYIQAMMAMGATPEEIAEVRLADRNAQGITPEQEAEAERALAGAEVIGRLTVVRMAHSKTATVTDRLFGHADQILVLSGDGEVNFFGNGALCAELKTKFEGWNGGAGLGKSDGNGYWGGYPNHDEVLNFVKARVNPTYAYAVLDPRPIPAATEANEKIFSTGPVYGIEVTVPALATRCVANIDPQHAGGDATLAAIEVALMTELPPAGATLATVRADLDSVGAMAIFSLRSEGINIAPATERIGLIAVSDKFARGGYTGPKPLPTRDNPWNEETATAESSRLLAAIAAAVMDFKVPLTDRVATMEKWLLTGEEPKQYRDSVEKERLDMITAIESGAIKHETHSEGRIAVVESIHRAATMVGYSLAPVVVALNPAFRQGPGEPYKKFTICAFEARFADIKAALAELATLEPGWGGSPTIGGSPQGVSSALTIDQVVEVVAKHLR